MNLAGYAFTIGLAALGVYGLFAAAFPELPVAKVVYWNRPRDLIARSRLLIGGTIALAIAFFVLSGQ
jgi:hypothetical protein